MRRGMLAERAAVAPAEPTPTKPRGRIRTRAPDSESPQSSVEYVEPIRAWWSPLILEAFFALQLLIPVISSGFKTRISQNPNLIDVQTLSDCFNATEHILNATATADSKAETPWNIVLVAVGTVIFAFCLSLAQLKFMEVLIEVGFHKKRYISENDRFDVLGILTWGTFSIVFYVMSVFVSGFTPGRTASDIAVQWTVYLALVYTELEQMKEWGVKHRFDWAEQFHACRYTWIVPVLHIIMFGCMIAGSAIRPSER